MRILAIADDTTGAIEVGAKFAGAGVSTLVTIGNHPEFDRDGFVVDADSVCVRPLDDSLLDNEAFACWENETARPGLIAAGYFGCSAENPFVGQIVNDIHNEATVVNDMAWKTVGPPFTTSGISSICAMTRWSARSKAARIRLRLEPK